MVGIMVKVYAMFGVRVMSELQHSESIRSAKICSATSFKKIFGRKQTPQRRTFQPDMTDKIK